MVAQRIITLEQSLAFALLSGDSNPLHVDPIAARRLQFGGCVVHGVNLTLLMLEEAIRGQSIGTDQQLAELSIQYDSALRSGEPFEIAVEGSAEGELRVSALSAGRTIQRLVARLVARAPTSIAIGMSHPENQVCEDNTFEQMVHAEGEVPLTFEPGLARILFPRISDSLPRAQIAVLLASTLIVGMRLPGLHSVYASLKLDFRVAPTWEDLRYRVAKADRRFNLITIDLEGGGAVGAISALVRPQPARQADYASLQGRVSRPMFAGRRVFVVGGSRGIGEATAKIAAAAGGNVTITYAAGHTDAARIQSEILAGGGKCTIAALDVLAALPQQLAPAFASGAPDDIFYFASPTIDVSRHPAWRPQLFQRFVDYYVTAFSNLIDHVISLRAQGSQGLRVFYPSTVFLDTPPAGSLEYCAAKAAGEVLCRGWATGRQGIEVVYPRIPRLLTDQTAALRSGALQLPAEYMLSILADWRSGSE